ncbi:MAG: hypothetical protein VX963_11060 [Actinomycetota bacterium]|jgi:hypothetical protein|nr:hypothetical protein [Acidimicrobiaceae bacterium]MEC7916805.1 hypothetical protein [Actinomycetota bacterium]MEC9059523.1 hypothetical protein [Actinomycetota bacterium]MEE3255946.1 hypothetical protein [Actinomycetota bacterium]
MQIERDTRGVELGPNQYEDAEGYIAPLPAGFGPRSNPLGEFPTGPGIGQRLPDVVALNSDGKSVDVHSDRDGKPVVLVFTRSAVW